MHQVWRRSLLLSALALTTATAAPVSLYAQQLSATRGGLGGVITDKSGAIIPDAKVTVTGAADHRVVTTDSAGRFLASDLTPGLYTLSVEKAGFQGQTAKNLEVVINKTNSVDFSLANGNVAETVEVNATTVGIDTSSTAVSDNLTATFYQQVPVARNIGSLFYVSPGVVDGGGTGQSNPSVGGATGLENLYLVDGVVLNDSGYGGLGVFSPIYGSLGTGINLSFIQEVQVKTAAYEPKYGGVNGGVLQIVTKSGGSKMHGAIAAYMAPGGASAGYHYADTYRQDAPPGFLVGKIFAQPAYDASVELGGYIPVKGQHDRLFYFGSFNPSLTQVDYRAANNLFSSAVYNHGPYTASATTRSWAGKLSAKITEGTTLDASAFGDPAHNNYSYGFAFAIPNPIINLKNTTGFSTWGYGSRATVVHLASSINATTQVNIAATYKTSGFNETGFDNIYSITDETNGTAGFQGLTGGAYQNPTNKSYGATIDIQKIVSLFGAHTFSGGFGFGRATYVVTRDYTGPRFSFPTTNIDGTPIQKIGGNDTLAGASSSASFFLEAAPSDCPASRCPLYKSPDPTVGAIPVYLAQVRGYFSGNHSTSNESYLSSYVNDSWAVGRRVTLNAGLRWEEEQLNGPNQQYVFNDNWSPRLGINIDPFADRKTKIYFNWGRYTQGLPTDAAIRVLNQELDIQSASWAAPSVGGNLRTNADGTITPILDAAHLLSGAGSFSNLAVNSGALELIHAGTRLNFEEEYLLGFQREVASGMVLDVRYSDRRLERIVEDMQGISPEGANAGLPNQTYLIGNPSPSADYFTNEQEVRYDTAPPAGCVKPSLTNPDPQFRDYGLQQDSLGNTIGGACGQNPDTAGLTVPDGKPDGFAKPVRRYQSFEAELNKNFSRGFLIRANYRFAKLYGNYEGLFRNDNGQSDPGISSLFDFTQGVVGLLGAQFAPGYLNTDRRDVGNLYGSYTIPGGFFHKLTGGMGLRGQTGTPISRLASHPVYHTTGEIPIGGRGTAGTTPTALQLDMHADYPFSFGEKGSLKLAFDGFNVTNSQFIKSVNQNIDTGFQTGADPTFRSPTIFQRAFYGRFSVRYEF